jgi:hypothetical protein
LAEQFSHPDVIFLVVRSRCPMLLALVFAVAAISFPGVAAAASTAKPTKTHHKKGLTAAQMRAKQIATAVKNAENSPDLWATVNICSSAAAPTGDTVGIRGQMPSLGITATLSMNISVSYWNGSAFAPVTNASDRVSLGKGTHGIHQGGVNFPIDSPASGSTYLVRGTITFEWTIAGKVVGKVTRNTGHGYTNVGFSNPPGLSEGTCSLM